jgi:HEAT repeat protein
LGVCWWLLAGYSADAIPKVDSDDQLVSVLKQTNSQDVVRDVGRLVDRFDFGGLTEPTLVATLQKTLQHDNPYARQDAAYTLVNLADGASLPIKICREIIQTLQTTVLKDDSHVRQRAAGILARLTVGESVPNEIRQNAIQTLQLAFQDGNYQIRRDVAYVLVKLANEMPGHIEIREKIIQTIKSALQTEHDLFKRKLCKPSEYIAKQHPDAVAGMTEKLVQIVEEEGFKMSPEAIRALRNIGCQTNNLAFTHIKSIRRGLESEKPRIRTHSATDLVLIEGPIHASDEQLSIISEGLTHPKDEIRQRTIKSLFKIANTYPDFVRRYEEDIITLLNDEYIHAQKYAIRTAGRLNLSEAEEDIQELSNHRYPWIREAAVDALDKVNPTIDATPFPEKRIEKTKSSCPECEMEISQFEEANFCPGCGGTL